MKMKITAIILTLCIFSIADASLISHYEFEGDLTNSIQFAGDGTSVGGADAVCVDPNAFSYPTIDCYGDLSGDAWIHVGYPGILYNPVNTQQLSIAMWVRTNGYIEYAQLFGRRYEWRAYIQEGKAAFGALDTDTDALTLTGTQSISDGLWHHVAVTYNANTGEAAIYIDGQLDVTVTQSSPQVSIVSSLRTAIGAVADGTTEGGSIYDGYLEDLRVYDNVLSLSDVQQLYNFTSQSQFCLNTSELDFNGDCVVNSDDLKDFAADWLDSAAANAVPDTNLVSYYEFNDWTNSVSGGYTLAPKGGANIFADPQRGYVGGFQYFDSADEWAYAGYDPAYNGLSEMTVAAYVKSNTTNWGNAKIVGKGYGWYLYVSASSNLGFGISGNLVTGSAEINDGLWHHVAATYDSVTGEIVLYVDGILDTQSTITPVAIPTSYGFAVGARAASSSSGADFYRGYIDDVRVYSAVLSAQQMYDLVVPYVPFMDLTGDSEVNFEDYSIIANQWLDCGFWNPADCN